MQINIAVIVSFLGLMVAIVSLVIAIGRLVWVLSKELQEMKSDIRLSNEVKAVKLIQIEEDLKELKEEFKLFRHSGNSSFNRKG